MCVCGGSSRKFNCYIFCHLVIFIIFTVIFWLSKAKHLGFHQILTLSSACNSARLGLRSLSSVWVSIVRHYLFIFLHHFMCNYDSIVWRNHRLFIFLHHFLCHYCSTWYDIIIFLSFLLIFCVIMIRCDTSSLSSCLSQSNSVMLWHLKHLNINKLLTQSPWGSHWHCSA